MQVVIDTNFILTCVGKKIDLFGQLQELLPEAEVISLSVVIDELAQSRTAQNE